MHAKSQQVKHVRGRKQKAASIEPCAAGLAARAVAVDAVFDVLERGRSFDGVLEHLFAGGIGLTLDQRDKALSRLIATTVLRRRGELEAVLKTFLEKPLPEQRGRTWPILLCGAAQLLVLGMPPHAAVGLSVELCRRDKLTQRFDRLVNAVLRRTSEHGPGLLAELDRIERNVPPWMFESWKDTYGYPAARRIAAASLEVAALDLTVKADAEGWAKRLAGQRLPTGSVRVKTTGRIQDLEGYDDGAWWVQDAAAAIPARLFGTVEGQRIADLCAAPGGKTAQLAAMGAKVTSIDNSVKRLDRLRENLSRLGLPAEIVLGDVRDWRPTQLFDGVLLDPPCTATGTLRRHPDILHLRRPEDVAKLALQQTALLLHAAKLVKPGGRLIYCTCSLQPEEGSNQIERFLKADPSFRREAIAPDELAGAGEWITAAGDLRTLPFFLEMETLELSGMDGFFAARLRHTT